MKCSDCDHAALTWNWHGYRNGCPDCEIRALAQSPKTTRDTRYTQLERKLGADPTAEIRRRVTEEYRRIKALKALKGNE